MLCINWKPVCLMHNNCCKMINRISVLAQIYVQQTYQANKQEASSSYHYYFSLNIMYESIFSTKTVGVDRIIMHQRFTNKKICTSTFGMITVHSFVKGCTGFIYQWHNNLLLISTQFGQINLNMLGRCSHIDINTGDMFSLKNNLAICLQD